MDAPKLEVSGPFEAWHGAAWHGSVGSGAGVRPVLVLLGPEGATVEALARARAAAAVAPAPETRGVLPLLGVDLLGDRIAWVHAHVDGIGLGHVSGPEPHRLLPTRTAAEAVACIAEALLPMSPEARRNRGPEPTDVIVDGKGRLYVAGFAGPYAMSPSMRAPRGDEGEPAVVYRLGVLLAHLLSGVPPQAASEESAHAALVRRALIRAMARPGPVLTERYGDWLRGMLAWEPSARPPLSTVPDGLRKVAEAMGGEGLVAWASANVGRIRNDISRARGEPPAREDDPTDYVDVPGTDEAAPVLHPIRTPPPQRVRTGMVVSSPDQPTLRDIPRPALPARPVREEFVDDDPTQEAASLPPNALRMMAVAPRSQPQQPPQIPVRVGPPPEALRPPPRLPSGFLDQATGDPESETTGWRHVWRAGAIVVYALCVVLLGLAAAVFLVYLLWVPPAPAEPEPEPSLSDVLGQIEPAAPVVVPAAVPEPEPEPEVAPAPDPRPAPEPPAAEQFEPRTLPR